MRTLGIDEAGRGCVFGPLVVAGFLYEGPDPDRLFDAGAGDSKAMTPRRREAVRAALGALGRVEIVEIGARAIDAGNLNDLEEAAIADLVRAFRPDAVVVDALGHPTTLPAVVARLRQASGHPTCTWRMEPKADANHAVVGAASVFAKTTRDARLDALRDAFGELGSGYPSDPKVRAWLTAWAATGAPWPDFVRTRWSTIATLTGAG